MENPTVAEQIVVLKVRDTCCGPSLKRLRKEVSKLDGVCCAYSDPKKFVIIVICKTDAHSALDTIAKSEWYEEIGRYYHNNQNKHHAGESTDQKSGGCGFKAEVGGRQEHRCEAYIPPPPNYYSNNLYSLRSHDPYPRNSGYPPRQQPSYGHRPFGHPSSWFDFSGFSHMPGSGGGYGGRGWGVM